MARLKPARLSLFDAPKREEKALVAIRGLVFKFMGCLIRSRDSLPFTS